MWEIWRLYRANQARALPAGGDQPKGLLCKNMKLGRRSGSQWSRSHTHLVSGKKPQACPRRCERS
ncbi:hypothetical protein DPMN_016430 [Dreissena polymorpha]|uniref:Uncharacterized protein n=1 Tax=Dreissena polymorpha TaxID=45954 RepID=A0A9D4NDD4_DREPO|nr:hypothetical protein DPMN_016430 [Dreissena polymorpha]